MKTILITLFLTTCIYSQVGVVTSEAFGGYINLKWECSDPDSDALTYDIYFGTENPPPLIVENHPEIFFTARDIQYSTQYFWKIVARDEHGLEAEGEIWNFTTEDNPNN